MTWQLRRAELDDLDAIMSLERETFGSDAWAREGMRSEIGNVHSHYLVAFRPETPDAIDGYAGLFGPRGSGTADVHTIAVAVRARRNGLGRVLMGSLLREARERGATEVFLEVREDNAGARSLYSALGFDPISVRVGYYQPDGVDAIVMRLRVEPPVTRFA